jgi:hypothetical protein
VKENEARWPLLKKSRKTWKSQGIWCDLEKWGRSQGNLKKIDKVREIVVKKK